MSAVADDIQFWQAGEWTMVYLNGELVRYGGHDQADEWLRERCGVVVVQDGDYASVPNRRNPVHLLAEAEENRRTATDLREAAERKREQARKLLAEADEMEV